MNNETEDAVRLEVKLFSGYYLDEISSTSVPDVHHGSHANHIWFVFAKVKSTVNSHSSALNRSMMFFVRILLSR